MHVNWHEPGAREDIPEELGIDQFRRVMGYKILTMSHIWVVPSYLYNVFLHPRLYLAVDTCLVPVWAVVPKTGSSY